MSSIKQYESQKVNDIPEVQKAFLACMEKIDKREKFDSWDAISALAGCLLDDPRISEEERRKNLGNILNGAHKSSDLRATIASCLNKSISYEDAFKLMNFIDGENLLSIFMTYLGSEAKERGLVDEPAEEVLATRDSLRLRLSQIDGGAELVTYGQLIEELASFLNEAAIGEILEADKNDIVDLCLVGCTVRSLRGNDTNQITRAKKMAEVVKFKPVLIKALVDRLKNSQKRLTAA